MSRYMRVAATTAASALLTMGGIATADATTVVPGSSAANPIVVTSLTDVPQGAVQDKVSTFDTEAKCDTTKSWVLPGSDAVTHPEGQYLRVIAAQDAVTHQEFLYQREVPGTPAVTHQEWNIEGRAYTPAVEEVSHQEYKYERTTCSPDLWWNWSPNDTKGPQDYEPSFPSDERGTWQGPHENGGPDQGTYGTFNSSNENSGNSSWFHRDKGECTTETTGWLTDPPSGKGWKQVDEKTVTDVEGVPGHWGDWTRINKAPYLTEPTAPANTDTHQYRVTDPITVIDTPAVEGYTETTDWLLGPPEGEGWVQIDQRTVTDVEPVPEYTEYYVVDAEPSRNIEDASWVTLSPGESWTLFNERVVTDTAAVAPVFYAWSDNAPCTVVDAATNPVSQVDAQTGEQPVALAQTGSDTWRLVGIGIALLLAGTALVVAGRKKGVTTA